MPLNQPLAIVPLDKLSNCLPRFVERVDIVQTIGEFFKRKTLPFNGYADQVASLYAGMDLVRNF